MDQLDEIDAIMNATPPEQDGNPEDGSDTRYYFDHMERGEDGEIIDVWISGDGHEKRKLLADADGNTVNEWLD